MSATKIAAARFRKVVQRSDVIRDICVNYNEVLLSQARVTAACNALHPIEARFCRWLLQSADRAGSDTIGLTQEFLAEMLGVRRTSVTEIAAKIQAQRPISYARGMITILDRKVWRFGRASVSKHCWISPQYYRLSARAGVPFLRHNGLDSQCEPARLNAGNAAEQQRP
jgi:hypothetical protein